MAQTSQAKAQTMRAVALDKFGGPEALKIQNVPIPQIEALEVLIRVEAAGVGAWDPFEREGRFVEIMGTKPTFPYVLGTDGAGTIAAVGKDVNRFKEGDGVCLIVNKKARTAATTLGLTILLTVLWIYLPMLLAAPTDLVALTSSSTHCFSAEPSCS